MTLTLLLTVVVPYCVGVLGIAASMEEEQQAANQPVVGCPAPPEVIAETIQERLPRERNLWIPVEAVSAYCSAAGAYEEVDWTILAGIGEKECDHGESPLPGCPHGTANFCGARGPMQFLGNTWRAGTDPVPSGQCPGSSAFTGDPIGPPIPEGQEGRGYATDGDGDGTADPWQWADATHAAARYLLRFGMERDQRQALLRYNESSAYVNGVLSAAAKYRDATADLGDAGDLAVGECPPGMRQGSTEHIVDRRLTEATRRMANAVIECFGQGPSVVGCFALRQDGGEHPLGRACDFMVSRSGNMPDAAQQARGDALAAWVQAHARELDVLYVIWRNRIWHVDRDGNVPWERWRSQGKSGVRFAHYDHVHVSIRS